MNRKPLITIGIIVFMLIYLAGIVAPFYIDLLWFGEVGYKQIFLKNLYTGIGLGVASGILFFLFVYINLLITRRLAPKYWAVSDQPILEKIRQFFRKAARWVILLASFIIAIMAGASASNEYDTLLRFLNSVNFLINDPIFNIDIGFYVFKLPFYHLVFNWIVALLFTTAIATAVTYLFDGSIEVRPTGVSLLPHVKAHLSVLLALFLVALAFNYRLNMFELLYSTRGVVSGASYTDIHANLPVLWILLYAALISAVIVLFNITHKGWRYPVIGISFLVATSIIAGGIYPALVQQFRVAPNELKSETPYIKRSIKFTQKAYNLDKVKKVPFKVDNNLTLNDIKNSEATIDNIRLWDWRPTLTSYQQLQEIRPYYVFNDVDVDRYTIDGKKRQVVLAARELSAEKLQGKARTWVNKHTVFTHGYGITMNAVNEVSPDGLPQYLIKDLPPVSKSKDLKIDQPSIYFGETYQNSDYAVVNTQYKEFDYPKENGNASSHYKGKGGFQINSFLKKAALAFVYNDVNIAISSAIEPKSRIILNRNIVQRVKKIAPFISLDNDPYIVINDGRLFWMIDGYTTTKNYPYSQPINPQYNYVRNSVKIVVDAYNGDVKFYTSDKKDPLIKAYSKIYPSAFISLNKMPKGLLSHVRYPEDLFALQSEAYATYHIEDPQSFFSKEDQWDIPKEIFNSQEQLVEPYYVILQLAQSNNDFQIIRPFTPKGKNNMIAWMSINSEPNKYGEILLYQFPRSELVFGTAQVEARIDQEPDISERFTLWNQSGSTVIRGNLLVIPIKNSLLFVEPIYLQSSQSQIPELKRVIAVLGQKVSMGINFEEAISGIFSGTTQQKDKTDTSKEDTTTQTKEQLIQKANDLYTDSVEAQKKGDWSLYGEKIKELGATLDQLKSTK